MSYLLFNEHPLGSPLGAYNAELVKQLSTEMEVKIGSYEAPVRKYNSGRR